MQKSLQTVESTKNLGPIDKKKKKVYTLDNLFIIHEIYAFTYIADGRPFDLSSNLLFSHCD